MTTLIVIDDEADFADFVAKIAASVGITAQTATSPDAFLAKIGKGWPTVIVMDLQMPEMDGIELLRLLGEKRCPSKIVIASGMDTRVLDTARRLGLEYSLAIAGQISKPIRAEALRTLLSAMRSEKVEITQTTLAGAIDAGELFLEYQPQVDLKTSRLTGVEALVRWKTPNGTLVPPDAFIPIAEQSDLIDRLTDFVIDATFRQAGTWMRTGLDIQLSVNISAANLSDRHLPDRLADVCSIAGIKPERITLELTETASNQNRTMLLEVLGRLRIKGFRLSIDDFGTGYSSVVQLLRLPFSELKIDKSFIMDMDHAHESKVVAKTLIDMAHNLGLSTVAEGVESKPALALLNTWNCEIAQGFLLSRPVAPAKIEKLATSPWWRE